MSERVKVLECLGCSTVSDPYETVADFDECPECGGTETVVVYRVPCPAPDPGECTDDDHHYGIGQHVVEIDR